MAHDVVKAQLHKTRREFRRVLDRPGVEYRHNGQVYRLDRFEPWTNRWGRLVQLAVWRAPCLERGAEFETALRWGDPPGTRRCLRAQDLFRLKGKGRRERRPIIIVCGSGKIPDA